MLNNYPPGLLACRACATPSQPWERGGGRGVVRETGAPSQSHHLLLHEDGSEVNETEAAVAHVDKVTSALGSFCGSCATPPAAAGPRSGQG